MTAKTTTVTVRLDPAVKKKALKVLDKLGISTSQAISMYFAQISEEQGLPFRPHIPNAETERVIREARAGINLHAAKDTDDLIAQLEA